MITDSGAMMVPMSPPADYWNGDDPVTGELYLAVTSYYDIEAEIDVALTIVAEA